MGLRLWRVAVLCPHAALNFIKLAAGVGLLLRKLAEGVGNFARSLLLLLSKAALFQKLAADLQDLLVQRVGGHPCRHIARFVAQVIELRAQRLREFGEVVDNLLILLSALKRAFPLLKRVQCGLERLDGLWLSGFGRFCLLQFLGYLFGVGGCRCVRPHAEAPGHQ